MNMYKNRIHNKLSELLGLKYRNYRNEYKSYNCNDLISTIYVNMGKNNNEITKKEDDMIEFKIINNNIYRNSKNIKHIINNYINNNNQVIIKLNDIFYKLKLKQIHLRIFINWLNNDKIDYNILKDIIEFILKPNINDYIIFKELCIFFNTGLIFNILTNNIYIFCYYLNNQKLYNKYYIINILFNILTKNNIYYINTNNYINFKEKNINSIQEQKKTFLYTINTIKKLTKKINISNKINNNKYIDFIKYDNLLINIYEIDNLLTYKEIDNKYKYIKDYSNNKSLFLYKKNTFNFNLGENIIEKYDNFINKFDLFTMGVLDDLNWNNIIYSGNSLTSLLNPKIKNINFESDIDLFVYGRNPNIRYNKIKYLCNFFNKKYKGNIFFAIQGFVITIFIRSNDFIRNIQIINTQHSIAYDIINNFDLSHVQVFYKNGKVFANYKFIKYYSMMCSKIYSTNSIEYRLYKTYLRGYNLINNNKVSLYNPDKYYYFNRYNIIWNENYKIIQKFNKYYYPNILDYNDRIIFLISKIFNINTDNINTNPQIIYNKISKYNKQPKNNGINKNLYLQMNINDISHIIKSTPITINNNNNIISNNQYISIRSPCVNISKFKFIYTCHYSPYNYMTNSTPIKYGTNIILPQKFPFKLPNTYGQIYILSLKLNKYSNRLIQYFDIIEKHIIKKLNIQTYINKCYYLNSINQTIDICCHINLSNNKIQSLLSNKNIGVGDFTKYNLYFKLIGINNIGKNYFIYEIYDYELLN
jgi:hypothetical protein